MKPEIYEQDGVKRCRIKVSDLETVDRIATDDDLLAAAEDAKQEQPKSKKKKGDE